MRFRRKGTNWEGRKWELVPCLTVLASEIEAVYPNPGPADGTVASRNHDLANPRSDHRPTPYSGFGWVRGLDAGEYVEDQGWHIAETIRVNNDPRIKYVIHEGQLFSSYPKPGYPPYTWRPYSGASPHKNHVHISTLSAFDADESSWGLTIEEDTMFLPIREGDGLGDKAAKRSDVAAIQGLLNRIGASLATDGKYGPNTVAAVKDLIGGPNDDGKTVNGNLFDDLFWKVAQAAGGGQGITIAQVDQKIDEHAANADAHHE